MTVAGPRYLGIAEVLRHSALGPALLSLEAIIDREPTREGLALALLALDRPEPVLRARAARYLMPWQSTSIGRRMVTLLHETNRELRSLALAWVARYQWQPALESLRALVTAAQFGHLPLAERVEATRTFGVVAGTSAVDVALRHLPHGWEHGELDRAVPWVSCLAATGLDEAEAPLDTLLAVAGGAVAQFAQDAVALWRRRRVELEAGIEGPAPAGAPATAGLRPQSVPAAAVPRRSYGRVPGERT
jgi:hypothetical protein